MGKTTNKLLAIAQAAIAGKREDYIRQLHDLRDFHSREARQVVPLAHRAELDRTLDDHFQEMTELVKGIAVLGELTPRSIDAISSYGERLSSYIVALAFEHFGVPAVHLDSRRVIVTDHRHTQAAPIFPETYKRLAETLPPLAEKKVVVMGGFIASTEEGVTTTLGRGGSDFTASIVGAGVGAEEIQIWTDVDGMLTADPTILPGGHRVKTISFAEAAELAYFGAKVLHPSTRHSGHRAQHSGAHPEFPQARSGRHPHRRGDGSLLERRKIHRVQAQDHTSERSLHPHADGARLSAPHLRDLRPPRNLGRYGGDERSQRISDDRQYRANRADLSGVERVFFRLKWSPIRLLSAWLVRTSGTLLGWRRAYSMLCAT